MGRRLNKKKRQQSLKTFWHTNLMSVYYLVFLLQCKKLVDAQSHDAFIRKQVN